MGLCKGGCGFFGNPDKGDYCSVCAKKNLPPTSTASSATTDSTSNTSTATSNPSTSQPSTTPPVATSNPPVSTTTLPATSSPLISNPSSANQLSTSNPALATSSPSSNPNASSVPATSSPSFGSSSANNSFSLSSFASLLSTIKPTETSSGSKPANPDLLANQFSLALKSTVDPNAKNQWEGLTQQEVKKKQQEEIDFLLSKTLSEQYNTPAVPQTLLKPTPPPAIYEKPPMFQKQKNENTAPPTKECIQRIMSDMKEIIKGDNPYLFVSPDEDDITHMNALIIGPSDSPYAHGFFHFDFIFPHDYPWNPPKVQLQTTDGGTCRFNPNLYANGKVCLSILGTWSGPGWTQIQTITSTMLSIQSLMNSKPYHNEPGFETERKKGDVEKYNQCITHETIRVAVVMMLDNPTCGSLFKEQIESYFLKNYEHYEAVCLKHKDEFDGKPMKDPFGEKRGNFQYGKLLEKLRNIKKRLDSPPPSGISTISPSSAPSSKAETSKKPDESKPQDTSKPDESKPQDTSKPDESKPQDTSKPDESKPQDTSKPNESKPQDSSVNIEEGKSSKQLEDDEEFARKLQEELNLAYEPQHAAYTPFGNYQKPKKLPTPNFTPVKPDLQALNSTDPEKVDPNFDPKIVCIICHQSPQEYIILPNCQQPHVYCMGCADKMIKQPSSNPMNPFPYGNRGQARNASKNAITCALCGVISNFDTTGITSLRRKRRTVTENNGKCSEHKDEDVSLFCINCMELICPFCTGSEKHKNHKTDSLENSKTQVQTVLQTQLNTLETKEKKAKEFCEAIDKRAPELPTATEKVQKELKNKFNQLRKLIDEKEKQMNQAIEKMHKTKQTTLEHEKKTAGQKVENIKNATEKIQSVLSESSALNFLQKVEEIEEEVRHSTLASDPEIKTTYFTMPAVYTQRIEQDLNYLAYKEHNPNGPYYDYNDEEYYSDSENEQE